MTNKKVEIKKARKLRWIRKRTIYTLIFKEFQDIWKAFQRLYNQVNYTKGDIKADLSLKELDNNIWNVIISVDNEIQVDLKGHLNLVLDNIQLFKRVYDFEKEKDDK